MPSRAWFLFLAFLALPLPTVAHETVPAVPTELIVLPRSTTEIQLFWTDGATNETSYRVEQRSEPGGPFTFTQVQSLPANSTSTIVSGLSPANFYEFRLRSANNAGFSSYSNVVSAFTDQVTSPSTCVASSTALCLNHGRFRVQSTWETSTDDGFGIADPLSNDSGTFTFFNPDNVELLVKVLNACGVNQRYWVFASGLTDVRVLVTVTDTQNGRVRRYFNPQGKAFAPVQDTSAFATCP